MVVQVKIKVSWAVVESMKTEKNWIFLGCILCIKPIGLFDCGNKDCFKVFGPSNGVYGNALYYGRLGKKQICGGISKFLFLTSKLQDACKPSKGP